MNNKDIQEERIKKYFVQAAIEILRGEGISNLSVRNVAEKAGYSYATLYNYFKNLNELLSVCIDEFLLECKELIISEVKEIELGKPRIQKILKSYVKYFIQYPGIFELFYITPLSNTNSSEAIITFLEDMCSNDWNHLLEVGQYSKEDIEEKKENIKYLITGLLVLYNNRGFPDDYPKFQESLEEIVSKI